jgi:FixJ family two-component response regulator
MEMMKALGEIVYIVDHDDSVRRSLKRLVKAFGIKVRTFPSVAEFAGLPLITSPACLIIDADAARHAADLPQTLEAVAPDIHVIVITVSDRDSERQLAKDLNATMCLQKPIDSQALLDSIRWSFKEARPSTVRGRR